jgi:hypothetical protein
MKGSKHSQLEQQLQEVTAQVIIKYKSGTNLRLENAT